MLHYNQNQLLLLRHGNTSIETSSLKPYKVMTHNMPSGGMEKRKYGKSELTMSLAENFFLPFTFTQLPVMF